MGERKGRGEREWEPFPITRCPPCRGASVNSEGRGLRAVACGSEARFLIIRRPLQVAALTCARSPLTRSCKIQLPDSLATLQLSLPVCVRLQPLQTSPKKREKERDIPPAEPTERSYERKKKRRKRSKRYKEVSDH